VCGSEKSAIPFLIPDELTSPKISSRLRHATARAAFMSMPETSMDEDCFAFTGEGNIRASGDAIELYAEPIAEASQQPTHNQLGLCIRAPDASHMSASRLRRHAVNHLDFPLPRTS
jgi:hypothetical protein